MVNNTTGLDVICKIKTLKKILLKNNFENSLKYKFYKSIIHDIMNLFSKNSKMIQIIWKEFLKSWIHDIMLNLLIP